MRQILLFAAALLFTMVALAPADDSPPTTQPAAMSGFPATTLPQGFSIRGRLSAHLGLDLQAIDLARAVVYLDSDPVLDAVPIPPNHMIVAQLHKAFVPRFLVIPRQTVVEFPNWDHIYHNVFSRSAAAPAFDLDRYPYGQSKTRQFDKAGVVQLFCNIHPYMRALIFVTPNRFFARADKDGAFQIDHVPPGHYQLCAWQERCQTQRQPIAVVAGDVDGISMTLSEDRASILQNDPPHRGNDYGVEAGLGIKRERLDLPVVGDVHPAPTTEPSN